MRKILVAVFVTFLASTAAHAKLPRMNATCPGNISVHYDGKGHAYINGNEAKFSPQGNGAYKIQHAGITYDILMNPDNSIFMSYTGKHGAHGVCQILDSEQSGSNQSTGQTTSSQRAGQGIFDATGNIPCAQYKGQPMGQCPFGVARDGGGSAMVVVTHPDGRKRAIFFAKGNPISADLSQADGNLNFRAIKEADLYIINAGDERYEIPEAVIFGG